MDRPLIPHSKAVEIIAKCTNSRLSETEADLLVRLIGDTIASALGRGHDIRLNHLGTFTVNHKGWVRFRPGLLFRSRMETIQESHEQKK